MLNREGGVGFVSIIRGWLSVDKKINLIAGIWNSYICQNCDRHGPIMTEV